MENKNGCCKPNNGEKHNNGIVCEVKNCVYHDCETYCTAEKIAEKFSCPLIDIRSPFLLSHNYTNLLSPDGIHPNVEGHEMIDKLLCEAVA